MAQVFAGARYRVSERFALHAQLRYRYADDVKVSLADSLSIPVDYEKFLILIGANLAF